MRDSGALSGTTEPYPGIGSPIPDSQTYLRFGEPYLGLGSPIWDSGALSGTQGALHKTQGALSGTRRYIGIDIGTGGTLMDSGRQPTLSRTHTDLHACMHVRTQGHKHAHYYTIYSV